MMRRAHPGRRTALLLDSRTMDERLAAEWPERRERLHERLENQGIDALFLPPSADLEYLTGVERDLPSFGEIIYAHNWVTGAFLVPGREPLFVLPRMFVAFHLGGNEPGETSSSSTSSTTGTRSVRVLPLHASGAIGKIAVGTRTSARTTLGLQDALPAAQVVDGGSLVAGLRRVKSDLELELMTTACGMADAAMAATAARVVPGVTMRELQEDIEHELSIRGSRCPSFPTHIFSWLGHDSADATGDGADRRGRVRDVRLRRRAQRLLLRLRPHSRRRRASSRVTWRPTP